MFRLGFEFLLCLAAVIACVLIYFKLVKSPVVRDLSLLPDEEAALRAVDEALELAEEVADDLEEAQCRRDAMLKELRRKTRM